MLAICRFWWWCLHRYNPPPHALPPPFWSRIRAIATVITVFRLLGVGEFPKVVTSPTACNSLSNSALDMVRGSIRREVCGSNRQQCTAPEKVRTRTSVRSTSCYGGDGYVLSVLKIMYTENGICRHPVSKLEKATPIVRIYSHNSLHPMHGELVSAASYRWTGWDWERSGWISRLQEESTSPSLERNLRNAPQINNRKPKKIATCNRLQQLGVDRLCPKISADTCFTASRSFQCGLWTCRYERGGSTRGNYTAQITNNGWPNPQSNARTRVSTYSMLRRWLRCLSKYLKSCLRRTECVPAFDALDRSQLMELVATVTAASKTDKQARSLPSSSSPSKHLIHTGTCPCLPGIFAVFPDMDLSQAWCEVPESRPWTM